MTIPSVRELLAYCQGQAYALSGAAQPLLVRRAGAQLQTKNKMLLHLQFPIADLRSIAKLHTKLPVPSWPSPVVHEEFVRSFGGVRRRWGGGISGWVAESEFCDARKAIGRIDGKALRYFSECNIRFRTVFRRLYSDGLALAKVELGLGSGDGHMYYEAPEEGTSAPLFQDVEELLREIFSLSIKVKKPNGSGEVELSQAGKSLAALYEFSTTRCDGRRDFEASGFVRPESPMLFIEAARHELEAADLPFHKKQLTLGPQISNPTSVITEQHVLGPELFHWWTKFGNLEISVWLLRGGSGFSSEPVYIFERNLRIYLLRLHAERVVLRRALKFIGERECSSDALQHYFNVATKRVRRYERHTTELAGGADDVALFAQSFMDAISPGELDGLLQRISTIVPRTNIERKMTEYAKSIVNFNNYLSIGAGAHMGDNYVNSGQAANMGPNASVSNVTQNQITSGDSRKLASELQTLLQYLKPRATGPEEQVALEQLESAEKAVTQNEHPRAMVYLKNAGVWALDAAKALALPIATEMIKKALGMG
jgi:hypothetical protein